MAKKEKLLELPSASAVLVEVIRQHVHEQTARGVRRMMAELFDRLGALDEEGRKEAALIYLRFIKEGGNSACTEMYADIEKNGFNKHPFQGHGH